MKMALADILVEERRREEMGDIGALARSIKNYGLLHPIVVSGNTLVAGERRLRAYASLGFDSIEATDLGDLDEEQRRAIELEENERRKDLTSYERSKQLVRKAQEVAPIISSSSEEKAPQGRPSQMEAPKADVADALGVSVGSLVKAEQHVAAVEKYPELEEADQALAIHAAVVLDAQTPEVVEEALGLLKSAFTPTEESDPAKRERRKRNREAMAIVDSIIEEDEELRRGKVQAAWLKAAGLFRTKLLALNAEEVAAALDRSERESAMWLLDDGEAWFARFRSAAPTSGLHLVEGGQRS